MENLDRITVNPQICLGQPSIRSIRSIRITVSVILRLLAGGSSIEEVMDAYPELEAKHLQQALQHAA